MYISLYYFITVDTVVASLTQVFIIYKETVWKLGSPIGVSCCASVTTKHIF